jgi:hypothetical protein
MALVNYISYHAYTDINGEFKRQDYTKLDSAGYNQLRRAVGLEMLSNYFNSSATFSLNGQEIIDKINIGVYGDKFYTNADVARSAINAKKTTNMA